MRHLLCVLLMLPLGTVAQRQFIKGQLYWTPDQSTTSKYNGNITYKDKPVEIIVFEQVTSEDVSMLEGNIHKILARKVARKFCKWDGTFKVRVEPGRYSVFAFVDGYYFGNLKDAEGHLSPVDVLPRQHAWITITMHRGSKP